MSRYAIISDIHSNRHALEAVLRRIDEMGLTEIVCLGDIVGYGPYPDSCLNMVVKHCAVTVFGNHDEAVINPRKQASFNGAAREALEWTRRQLGPLHLNALCRMKAVATLPGGVTCVHDSPTPGPVDYVHDPLVAAIAFSGFETPICLLGHTHVPMVFETPVMDCTARVKPVDVVAYVARDGVAMPLRDDARYICNPGSVGQPRDCDPRASFAVLDLSERTFTVHRVEYDIASAQIATQRAGLPMILADRLAIGA
jgi:predicted phosphodiesterase